MPRAPFRSRPCALRNPARKLAAQKTKTTQKPHAGRPRPDAKYQPRRPGPRPAPSVRLLPRPPGLSTAPQTLYTRPMPAPAPADKPSLVLQMQRMGDIVLSFPLFLWLKRNDPRRPLWVVAEPAFYQPLLTASPQVTYLPWTAAHELAARAYHLLVNLSHRPEAAQLAASLDAAIRIGPMRTPEGALRVLGAWQLYRTALTGNNRHNRFHWAELNALDCVDKGVFAATTFDAPRHPLRSGQKTGPVGLFLGASEDHKRPSPRFWAHLAAQLQRRGLKAVLLGGPADAPLAQEVRRLHGGTLADFCGKLGLDEFMAVGQTLSLMITPDTGPMHLAAWSGLLTLNLSMGPVNPWETGPYVPGHYVLRADISCLNCWRCRFHAPHCRDRFDPSGVAYLAWRLIHNPQRLTPMPRMRLLRTGRTPDGFYDLAETGGGVWRATDALGEFWRGAFGWLFGLWGPERARDNWRELARRNPQLARAFTHGLARLAPETVRLTQQELDNHHFWNAMPQALRPLAGYLHMYMQNQDASRQALAHCLELMERVRGLTA